MIDICQWRASIGLWYHCQNPQGTRRDILIGSLWSGDENEGYLTSLFLTLFISLLFIVSGDIELNPGPETGKI